MLKNTDKHESPKNLLEIGDYVLVKPLGMGAFGKVKQGVHKRTGTKVAIKVMAKKKIKETKMAEKVHREINCQKKLSHPHVVRLYEVIDTPTHIFVVLEFCSGGELFDYIVSRGKLELEDARRMFQQLICALDYSHHHSVIHRDLKPENVLLDERANVKIADFGLCNTTKDGDFIKTSCGSPNYAAPEVISNSFYAGPEVDVWSAGVIFYALMCGSLPFDDDNIPNLFRKIKSGFFYMPSHLTGMAKDLISRMLTVDPLKRITIKEIRQHPWFQVNLPAYLSLTTEEVDHKYIEEEPELIAQVQKLHWDFPVTLADVQRAVRWGTKSKSLRRLDSCFGSKGNSFTKRQHNLRRLEVAYFILREQKRQQDCWEDLAERNSEMSLTPPCFTPSHAESSDSEGFWGSTHHSKTQWMKPSHAQSLMEATNQAFGVNVPPPPPSVFNNNVSASPYAIRKVSSRPLVGMPANCEGADGAPKRRRWFLGIQSKKEPCHIMMELFRILYMLGCTWRKIEKNAGYRLYVAWEPNAARPPQAAYIEFPLFCQTASHKEDPDASGLRACDSSENLAQDYQESTFEFDSTAKSGAMHHPGGPSQAPDYFENKYRMKLGLALYKLDVGLYLLDFWLIEGHAFFFMQLCATIIMNLKKGSAREQRAKLAEEGMLPKMRCQEGATARAERGQCMQNNARR